jgi:hypothetical protein
MRSKLITTCLLIALVAMMSPTGAQAVSDLGAVTPRFEPAVAKYLVSQDHTVPAIPAHLPAPTSSTGIGPGAHLLITMDDEPDFLFACTANFIYKPAGTSSTRYLGAAGHCFVPAGKTATHGPGADYNPSRTHVRVCVSSCLFGGETGFFIQGTTVALGSVAYARLSQNGEVLGNDFGIVTIPPAVAGQIRASLPVWGGPKSTAGTPATGALLCLYGNGVGVGETFPTMARAGIGMNSGSPDRWGSAMPSMQGDSGSAVVTCGQDADGLHGIGAVGVLTHITAGLGFIAGTTVSRSIAMAAQVTGLNIQLVLGS